ncbi:MAG: DUF1343 domain-containing protein [Planctomycetota bacterium]|nr:DUF1343 domain-containing protein [Planctomycetota bacterium]
MRCGIDVLLSERIDLLKGKRFGLITNPAGVDGALRPTADLLARVPGAKLVRLFAPEHGIRGDVPAGEQVADAKDAATGIPVASLYGKTRRPTPEMLADLDVLVFDLQDVGSRTYTFVSTLGEAMIACAAAKKPLIVLDRPNPLGLERMEGPIRAERYQNFICWGPVPVVHGMTAGELARLYVGEMKIECDLSVVPVAGLTRAMIWDDTGLEWTMTSPHIPREVQAYLYVATGMIGGITKNVSDGVGTTMPFELIAAEWIDAERLAKALSAENLPGIRFRPLAVQPFYGKFAKKVLRGVQLVLDDPRAHRPLRTALAMMTALEKVHPGLAEYEDERAIGIHWGRADIIEMVRAGKSAAEIEATWAGELRSFAERRKPYLLYK